MSTQPHSGPVRVRYTDTRVLVLCPAGHVVTSRSLSPDWGGSDMEARIGAHQSGLLPWVVECDGTVA